MKSLNQEAKGREKEKGEEKEWEKGQESTPFLEVKVPQKGQQAEEEK